MTDRNENTERSDTLRARVEYLEEANRFILNALDIALALGDFQTSINKFDTPDVILCDTCKRVKSLIPFDIVSFFLVDEQSSDFVPVFSDPPERTADLQKELDSLIDKKVLAWAIQRRKPVFQPARDMDGHLLVHVLTTASRTRGVFIGALDERYKEVPDSYLAVFTIILHNCANALESFELYAMVRKMNRGLEEQVEKLACSEAELQETNEKLQHEINERIRAEKEKQILQSQLIHSQKLESIGRLAGGVAHDFNNILTAILGFCDLARYKLPEEHPVQEYLGVITSAGMKASSLIRQLLAFSRKQQMDMRTINLCQEVDKIGELILPIIGEDVTLKIHTRDKVDSVFADPGQVEQVLLNLSVNARDAMVHGGTLEITVENHEVHANDRQVPKWMKPGYYVLMTVRDTGEGMSEEVQKQIFEPFFTTKEVGKGTGLGLATVYGIVKQHNGYITVSSKVGAGATFSVYFPATARQVRLKPDDRQEAVTFKGKGTILVVEDDEKIRVLLSRILQPLGFQVLCAANGEEAVGISDSHQGEIDLLLSDVIMPGVAGPEVAATLREKRPAMQVIFMSGYPGEVISGRGLMENPEDFILIQKPLRVDELIGKLELVLGSKEKQLPPRTDAAQKP